MLLGREDNQLKINGFRVELGEIEHAMLQHPDIREAVVQPFGDKKNPRLAAYFTARSLFRSSGSRLKFQYLPGYIPWDGPKNPVHRLPTCSRS